MLGVVGGEEDPADHGVHVQQQGADQQEAHRAGQAAVEDDDAVGVPDGRQAVGDDQDGPAARGVRQRPDDVRLAAFVDGAGGLVQDQHRGVGQQRPGEGEPLALAAGQGGAAFAEDGPVTVGQSGDLVVHPGGAGGPGQLLVRRVRPGEPQVLGDGGVEEVRLLGDDGDVPAQRVQRVLARAPPAEEDPAAPRVVVAQQQGEQGALAGAGRSDDRGGPSRLGGEGDPAQRGRVGAVVGEVDVFEPYVGRAGPPRGGRALVGDGGRGGAQGRDAVRGGGAQVSGVPLAGQVPDGQEHSEASSSIR
ncbi:hypothetical protein SFUMM280S_06782 [Streptomyces fumanus]